MIRRFLLIPALTVACLPAGTSAAAPGIKAELILVHFTLDANHGMGAFVDATDGAVTLEVGSGHQVVTYKAPAEITKSGLKAQFGNLGQIDVTLEEAETVPTHQPPEGCEGKPSTRSKGLFTGTIEFTGERKFVRIETTEARGRISVFRNAEWTCPHKPHSAPGHGPPPPTSLTVRKRSGAEKWPTTLAAISRPCHCYFAAIAEQHERGRGPTYFFGAKMERREEMEITRVTEAAAPAFSFVFDHEAGTATVRPPQPFSGHATFKRRLHGPNIWRSTIRVPLLGTDPLHARGHSFRAKLMLDVPSD
jgi:hypothetical protein